MVDFKYTTKEKVEKFIFNLYENTEKDSDPIEHLKSQPQLMKLALFRKSLLHEDQALAMVETFLHLFEQSEDYELCAKIVESWPELLKNQ
tara:strand:+ start:5327 stop:5596 length:270 start_codon:yes stop_codon:yes gene_type:complete